MHLDKLIFITKFCLSRINQGNGFSMHDEGIINIGCRTWIFHLCLNKIWIFHHLAILYFFHQVKPSENLIVFFFQEQILNWNKHEKEYQVKASHFLLSQVSWILSCNLFLKFIQNESDHHQLSHAEFPKKTSGSFPGVICAEPHKWQRREQQDIGVTNMRQRTLQDPEVWLQMSNTELMHFGC